MSGLAAGVWSAPGRVNLIGEHTDYNDGFCLPFALPLAVTVRAQRSAAGSWSVRSGAFPGEVAFTSADLRPGAVTGWAAYVAGVVWALADAGIDVPGAELEISSDLPTGAGLSSSAALECAVLRALLDLGGHSLAGHEQALLAQRAENVYVGMPCGILDQSASVLSTAGHALFLDARSGDTEQVPFDLTPDGLAVLVVDSKAPHAHVDGEYADRRRSCEQAAAALGVPALRDIPGEEFLDGLADPVLLRRARHIVTENARVQETVELLKRGEVREIGPLLTASHASMRDDFQITVPQIDLAVETALVAGAYGARMTGGGFGGCVIALVDAAAADAVAGAVAKAFAGAGYPPPASFVATPSAGARRIA